MTNYGYLRYFSLKIPLINSVDDYVYTNKKKYIWCEKTLNNDEKTILAFWRNR